MTCNGRIALLRQRLGMSQRVFGERIGRSAGYINRIENGKQVPTSELIGRICTAFGVKEEWLRDGAGRLEVESVGDRFRHARKARDYTQGELAEEIGVSRNTVGMIERGTVRPGDEIVDSLCDRLWIDENWLLTGQGSMERTELTPFYELLKRDPGVRRHIRSYIDHLEKLRHPYREEEEEEQEDRWVTAYVANDIPAARLFFEHYHILYREEEVDGKISIKVKAPRTIDREKSMDIEARIRRARIPNNIFDHEFVFRDEEGNTIITYSPCNVESVRQTWIEKAENHLYGFGTTTFVVKC